MGVRASNGARPFLVAGAGRQRGSPLFSVWDLEIGGGGALRQQPLATAGRRAAFGCARTVLDFGIGRARPLLESARQGSALHVLASFPRAREGGPSASGFDSAAPARSYRAAVRREPIETAGRGVAVAGVRSGISGWRDRAPDPWACGRQGGARRIKINKATAKQSPRLSLTKSLNPKERLSVGNWIVQRLYDYAVKETVEI